MVDTTHFELTIPNPNDLWVPPIYTGDPAKVHEVLEPGTYKGIIENWALDTSVDVEVYVYEHFTNLRRFALAGEWR
jgi:hypothetical protein